MFDFQATLNDANAYAADNQFALAAFHYWLIGFAFENEEFPYSYTAEIGRCGRNGFLKYAKKYRNAILTDESYVRFKDFMDFPAYVNYFANFERVIKYLINRAH